MYEIRRIHPLSLARTVALITSIVHLLAGVIITLVYDSVGISALTSAAPDGVNSLSLLLVWMSSLLIVIPLSFLVGLLAAALYNLFARWWGGIKIDLAKVTTRVDAAPKPDSESTKEY